MQFKYPELLWALFLLLIPIIIHLFQLRRFKKTPFTNVKLLQKVVAESRRSSALKKWLLLFSRLMVVTGLVFAFSQPFFAATTALAQKETVIYLDNSFSMQAKKNEETLLEAAVQELIEVIPRERSFSLFTNEDVFKDVTLKDIQNQLLELKYSAKQLQLHEIALTAQTLFSSDAAPIKNCIIVSDFQARISSARQESATTIKQHLIQLAPDNTTNIIIDTAFISQTSPNSLELTTQLSGTGNLESIPVSLYNDQNLIAKTAAVFDEDNKASILFTLPPNEVVNGEIEISDAALSYDNQLFFNLNQKEKIKVLAIGDADDDYLTRLYADDEFDFSKTTLSNLNFTNIDKQNFIILNEIPALSNALQNALRSFISSGGSMTIIPPAQMNFESYNSFLGNYGNTTFGEKLDRELKVTGISFDHPLYQNVFEREVTNFQYPMVSQYYRVQSRAAKILSFQNDAPFLLEANGIYLFTSSLDNKNSNFKNSPLIVPTLYSMATNSLKLPRLYQYIGANKEVDIPLVIGQDDILKVSLNEYEFIPEQQYFANKTRLMFGDTPKEDGIYTVTDGDNKVQNLSFNMPRTESDLRYINIDNLNADSKNDSIAALFDQIEKDNRVTTLWKWFVILALLFMLTEIVIQKIFK
ncbi:BatA domain-containing protein [Muriicola sp. Z0-33]|uniref:BatA domain-containing protein n=1 Tax=Muriicola sp. Z0-33 TaxID=2816957 RepID=UPI0022385242|nr:BatA domain-containing protein [Muriicola sp. Z0-33]MCW5516656.1 BatA domain-containing protein [Muriicola sp. Z0-33]